MRWMRWWPYWTTCARPPWRREGQAWFTSRGWTTSRPFPAPETARIAVKVINHYGDEVMKLLEVKVRPGYQRGRSTDGWARHRSSVTWASIRQVLAVLEASL